MALFDKVTDLAAKATEKTSDVIEVTKLTNQKNSIEKNIKNMKVQLGDLLIEKHDRGEELPQAEKDIILQIKEAVGEISAIEAEINKIK